MESRNRLGIYIRKDRATVVCLAGQGAEKKLIDAFTITAEEEGLPLLVDNIVAACTERGIKGGETGVALDCALFMQHAIHSEFADYKRIAATVRFDTEEALATDVSNMAVSFRIASTDDEGAGLDVFTADRNVLSDILLSMQAGGMDPISIDPDVYHLSRYLNANGASSQLPEDGALCALLSDSRGYLVGTSNSQEVAMLRAFLVGSGQDRKELLGREVLVTAALGTGSQHGQRLCVVDTADTFTAQDLSDSLPLPAQDCDLAGLQGQAAQDLDNCANVVDFAIAYGAALPISEKENGTNFRNDHMPYLGEKRRLEKALRFLSVSLTILFLTLGIAAQAKLMQVNRDREDVREKIAPDYLLVTGKENPPETMRGTIQSLESIKRRIKARSGDTPGDRESIQARLTMVLKGVNACAAKTGLTIDTVNLTSQSIMINGDTSSRTNTLAVLDAMDKAGLYVVESSYEEEGKRDAFSITAEPKKRPRKD